MDPKELQANGMPSNHLQDLDISHHRWAVQSSRERSQHDTRTERRKERLLWMPGSVDENCKKRKKNFSTAWIDYKKAFDSVPHSWILKCLQMYKIHPVLITFIEESISQWKPNMTLVYKEGVLETGPIRIKRGIFQGNSLSPLLFTISLNPPKDRIWIPTG